MPKKHFIIINVENVLLNIFVELAIILFFQDYMMNRK